MAPAFSLSAGTFRQFGRYLAVGGTTTLVDWLAFYLFAVRLGLHYQLAVLISLSLAFVIHFSMNKAFTFKCESRMLVRQLLLHMAVSGIYTALSMGSMFVLVDLAHRPKMPSKILTTAAMMVVSFVLSKAVTFNKRFLEGVRE